METDEQTQDVDLENNETTEEPSTPEPQEAKEDTKGKILVDRAEYFKLKNSHKQEKQETHEEKPQSSPSDPVTKADLYKMNERQAIRIATTPLDTDTDEVATIKQEIEDNYEAISKFYQSRAGKEAPEDIVEDLFDAHAVWKRRNVEKTDNKRALSQAQRETGVRGTSPKAGTGTPSKIPMSQPRGLANWYPKLNN